MKARIIICPFLVLIAVFSSGSLFAQEKIDVTTERNNDGSVTFRYKKHVLGSYVVLVNFSRLENASFGNYSGVISNDRGELFTLRPRNKKERIRFSYRVGFIRGNPDLKADSLFTYVLPFVNGDSIIIKESNYAGELWGKESPDGWKSYRIMPKSNDTVCAARKGLVVEVIDKNEITEKSDEIRYTTNLKRNFIRVEHEDGSIASYFNFNKNSVFVEEGQTVYPQTRLGLLAKNEDGKRKPLSFSINYLDTKKINIDQTLQSQSHYKYITPYFLTDEGIIQLKPKKKYQVVVTDEILSKEQKKKKK